MDNSKLKYKHVIGIMSGTSLDGVDLAYCVFKEDKCWNYRIQKAETIPYPEELRHHLSQAMTLLGYELALLHHELGCYIAKQVNMIQITRSYSAGTNSSASISLQRKHRL